MDTEQVIDWIEHIVDKVNEFYEQREIILWGRYSVSETIQQRLKEKFKLDIKFYVDSDCEKVDNKYVFPVDCLDGRSKQYYVVIPLAFYQSVKEKLLAAGYKPNIDYYYFCDCILVQKPDYYEDENGNKIIGRYQGLKFAFSGFNSLIQIGDDASFKETCLYIHSNSQFVVGNGVQFKEDTIVTDPFSRVVFEDGSELEDSYIKLNRNVYLNIGYGSRMTHLYMNIGQCAKVTLHEKVKVRGERLEKAIWSMNCDSVLEVGADSDLYSRGSMLILDDKSRLIIGKKFNIGGFYNICLGKCHEVAIGSDSLFSQNLIMRSNDGHSIFDVETGENINLTPESNTVRRISIGSHVWVGIHCVILYNTRIEDGSIIGAMSLVKGSIPNNCIAAGVPAKVIRRNVAWCHEDGADSIKKCGMEYLHLTNE